MCVIISPAHEIVLFTHMNSITSFIKLLVDNSISDGSQKTAQNYQHFQVTELTEDRLSFRVWSYLHGILEDTIFHQHISWTVMVAHLSQPV